jgi:hypothetical protein
VPCSGNRGLAKRFRALERRRRRGIGDREQPSDQRTTRSRSTDTRANALRNERVTTHRGFSLRPQQGCDSRYGQSLHSFQVDFDRTIRAEPGSHLRGVSQMAQIVRIDAAFKVTSVMPSVA